MPESTQNPAMFFHHQIFETVKDKINNQLKVRLGVVKKLIEIASFSKFLGHLDTSLIHQPQDCINLLQNSIEKVRVPLLHLQGMGHVPVWGLRRLKPRLVKTACLVVVAWFEVWESSIPFLVSRSFKSP